MTSLSAISGPVIAAPAKALKIDDVWDCWSALKMARERLPGAMDVNPTLVRLRSREALRTVIENLSVLQAEIADLEESRSTVSGSPGRAGMIEALYRTLRDARDRNLKEIGAVLAAKPLKEPLPERFGLDTLLARLRQDLESAPEHLAGVVSPAW